MTSEDARKLIAAGWSPIDYPAPRGTQGYQYTVWAHKDYPGTWTLATALAIERQKASGKATT